MKRSLNVFAGAMILLAAAGCCQREGGFHVTDYCTSDPSLEPTLRVGGLLDVRTKDGGPVILQSQIDQQRKAAEQVR